MADFLLSQSQRLCFLNLFSDINQAHKNRQICSLIGVEGGHSLAGSLGVLRTFYSLGVRYMTLTSTCHTPWADSSNADAPKYDVKHGGLTSYGKVSRTWTSKDEVDDKFDISTQSTWSLSRTSWINYLISTRKFSTITNNISTKFCLGNENRCQNLISRNIWSLK